MILIQELHYEYANDLFRRLKKITVHGKYWSCVLYLVQINKSWQQGRKPDHHNSITAPIKLAFLDFL